MNTVRLYGLIMIIAATAGIVTHARIKEMRHERGFILKMEETPFGVVLFYRTEKDSQNAHRMMRHLKRDLQYVVEAGLYQNARVGLFSIDVARDDLAAVASRFGVQEYPTIMLFKGGVPLKNKKGKIVVLRGYASRSAIRTFIDKNMREDVMNFMQDLQESRDERARDRSHVYFSYGMTLPASVQYAYPYYYSPDYYYGYGAPVFGMELGF